MEITLEKIELVKDRTGVTYKEAKKALEECEGSVVDAIIAIEENVDEKKGGKVGKYASETVQKIKDIVKKGNISKIEIKKDDETIVNIPLNVGIVGAVIAPWGIIAAAIAAYGTKCNIVLISDEGKVVNVSEKADSVAETVKEKGEVMFDNLKEKGAGLFEAVKEKAPEKWDDLKEKGAEVFETVKEKTPDTWDELKEMGGETWEGIKEKAPEVWDELKEKGTYAWDNIKEKGSQKINEFREGRDQDVNLDIDLDITDEDVSDELNK